MSHDAVMVGSGTALADDPDLTVRDMGVQRQPIRIVLDRLLKHSPNSRIGHSAKDHPVWLLHSPAAAGPARQAWQAAGATLIETPATGAHLDLKAALQTLATRGLTRIFSEGGSTVAAALIQDGLVDNLALFSGGLLIGSEGHPALGPLGLASLAKGPRPDLRETHSLGPDLFSLWSF
jgi:diaminohydroxyphosphoribosylaminopyrimidine deaminase/5-amino-6-(5-phosphoribosylamino)uracil reductase